VITLKIKQDLFTNSVVSGCLTEYVITSFAET